MNDATGATNGNDAQQLVVEKKSFRRFRHFVRRPWMRARKDDDDTTATKDKSDFSDEDDEELSFDLSTDGDRPFLLFPGSGLLFFWQAGFVSHLQDVGYDFDQTTLGGASGGALIAAITAANVNVRQAVDLAIQRASEKGVFDHQAGLKSIWGSLTREWLNEVLPHNAVDLVDNRLSIILTKMPKFKLKRFSSFTNRDDLIDCIMASSHLPYFMDGKMTFKFRGRRFIDGGLWSNKAVFGPLLSSTGGFSNNQHNNVFFVDRYTDPVVADLKQRDLIPSVNVEMLWDLFEKGVAFAKQQNQLVANNEPEVTL